MVVIYIFLMLIISTLFANLATTLLVEMDNNGVRMDLVCLCVFFVWLDGLLLCFGGGALIYGDGDVCNFYTVCINNTNSSVLDIGLLVFFIAPLVGIIHLVVKYFVKHL